MATTAPPFRHAAAGLLVIAAALIPAAGFGATGSFNRASAAPGDTVTLSGKAKPNSSMSAYFYCDGGCGETHVGAVSADRNGNYSLTFKVPAQATPGSIYLSAGCDSCGNGWSQFRGLTVTAAPAKSAVAAKPPVAAPPVSQPSRPAQPRPPQDMIFQLANGGERY